MAPASRNHGNISNSREAAREDLATELFLLLRAVQHRERSFRRRTSGSSGVTGSERMVLRVVGRHPGLSSGDLARFLQLNPSTLTGVVDRLVQRRLLARRIDSEDRRRSLLALTAAGRNIDRLRGDTIESRFRRALARLSPAHVAGAAVVLAALARELSRDQQPRRGGSARVLFPFAPQGAAGRGRSAVRSDSLRPLRQRRGPRAPARPAR